jgi:Crp-like helix-turn-helix domain
VTGTAGIRGDPDQIYSIGAFLPGPRADIADLSFDHFVGACEQRGRHGEAKSLGGFEVRQSSNCMASVACNGAHRLKERLARWLLTMHDRGDEDALLITQSLLAEILGVQRPTITMPPESWNAQV